MIGLTATVSNQLIVMAIKKDKVSRVQGLNFIVVFLSFLEDVLIFKIGLSLTAALGASMIIICSVIVFVLKLQDND